MKWRREAELLPGELCLGDKIIKTKAIVNFYQEKKNIVEGFKKLPKALRTQALTTLTSSFGLVCWIWFGWFGWFSLLGLVW